MLRKQLTSLGIPWWDKLSDFIPCVTCCVTSHLAAQIADGKDQLAHGTAEGGHALAIAHPRVPVLASWGQPGAV